MYGGEITKMHEFKTFLVSDLMIFCYKSAIFHLNIKRIYLVILNWGNLFICFL